jgi:hypothetical protein
MMADGLLRYICCFGPRDVEFWSNSTIQIECIGRDFCTGRKQSDQSNQFHPTASATQSGRASKGEGRLDALGMELVLASLIFCFTMSAPKKKYLIEWKETSKIPYETWPIVTIFSNGATVLEQPSTEGCPTSCVKRDVKWTGWTRGAGKHPNDLRWRTGRAWKSHLVVGFWSSRGGGNCAGTDK